MNGVFKDDAERDSVIIRMDERQKEMCNDIKELKAYLERFCENTETKMYCLERDVSYTKTWAIIFSSVSIPVVAYLLQRALR